MKGFVLVNEGLEDTAKTEIKEIIDSKADSSKCIATFDFDKHEEALYQCCQWLATDREYMSLG